MIVVNLKGKDPRSIFSLNILLNTELLERSECQSTSDVDVGGVEFSGSDILQRSLKGLGFNLCVAPCCNG